MQSEISVRNENRRNVEKSQILKIYRKYNSAYFNFRKMKFLKQFDLIMRNTENSLFLAENCFKELLGFAEKNLALYVTRDDREAVARVQRYLQLASQIDNKVRWSVGQYANGNKSEIYLAVGCVSQNPKIRKNALNIHSKKLKENYDKINNIDKISSGCWGYSHMVEILLIEKLLLVAISSLVSKLPLIQKPQRPPQPQPQGPSTLGVDTRPLAGLGIFGSIPEEKEGDEKNNNDIMIDHVETIGAVRFHQTRRRTPRARSRTPTRKHFNLGP